MTESGGRSSWNVPMGLRSPNFFCTLKARTHGGAGVTNRSQEMSRNGVGHQTRLARERPILPRYACYAHPRNLSRAGGETRGSPGLLLGICTANRACRRAGSLPPLL